MLISAKSDNQFISIYTDNIHHVLHNVNIILNLYGRSLYNDEYSLIKQKKPKENNIYIYMDLGEFKFYADVRPPLSPSIIPYDTFY